MNFTRAYAIFLRQLFLIRYSPMRFVNIFAWSIIDVLIWGFMTRYLDGLQNQTFSFVPILIGAAVLWNFLIRAHQGVMMSALEDVWSRNFINLFASPLTTKEYIGGMVLTGISTSAVSFGLLLVLSYLAFGFNVFIFGLNLYVFLLILFMFGTALGILATALILRFGPAAEWVAWLIPAVILPFSGVFYPITALPSFLQNIAKILPTTYAFEGMRNVILGNGFSGTDAIIGCLLSLASLIAVYLFFAMVYRKVLKNGLIARFSAESMSS